MAFNNEYVCYFSEDKSGKFSSDQFKKGLKEMKVELVNSIWCLCSSFLLFLLGDAEKAWKSGS